MSSPLHKIMWLCPMCLFDRRSGAAQQMHSVLSALAESGWQAHAMHMTLFDGKKPYPVSSIIGHKNAAPENHGKTFAFTRDGIRHRLFYTRATHGSELTTEEARLFLERIRQALQEIKPDIILTYGGSDLSRAINQIARALCPKLVFFLANPKYKKPELFRDFDHILVNSNFARNYYRKKLSIDSLVLPEVLPSHVLISPEEVLAASNPRLRGFGFITMINPSPEKGGTMLAALAREAFRSHPQWTFLAVEGRMSADHWTRSGIDLARMPNILWVPNQMDMRRIYSRTSILLFPSFWEETAGRVGIEASLGGIPVIAANHGGIAEMLNGAGVLLNIPQRCREKFTTVPDTDEIRPWMKTICKLMNNREYYVEVSGNAPRWVSHHHPVQARQQVVELFNRLIQKKSGTSPVKSLYNKKSEVQVVTVDSY